MIAVLPILMQQPLDEDGLAGRTSGHCPIRHEPDEVDTEVGMGRASPLAPTRMTDRA